jgi:hypothetical protein
VLEREELPDWQRERSKLAGLDGCVSVFFKCFFLGFSGAPACYLYGVITSPLKNKKKRVAQGWPVRMGSRGGHPARHQTGHARSARTLTRSHARTHAALARSISTRTRSITRRLHARSARARTHAALARTRPARSRRSHARGASGAPTWIVRRSLALKFPMMAPLGSSTASADTPASWRHARTHARISDAGSFGVMAVLVRGTSPAGPLWGSARSWQRCGSVEV